MVPDYCRRPLLLPVDNIHPRMLRHLATADIIFCDGTFYTCPSLFHQLYTIHAMYPLVLGLLRGKDQTIYIRFFSHIKDLSRQQNLHLQPQTVFIDNEIATSNAATTAFPGVTIKGSFFHNTQCIWSKTQKYGLQTYYKANDDIIKLVRRAAVLPLVPQNEVDSITLYIKINKIVILLSN